MTEWIAVITITLLAVISPGADFALVSRNALLLSRRAGLFTALGIGLGVMLHLSYTLLGVGLLLVGSPALFALFKLAGAGYLIYLGLRLLLAPAAAGATTSDTPPAASARQALLAGWLTNALNPKTSVFIVSLFMQVVSPDTGLATQLGYGAFIVGAHVGWFALVVLCFSSGRLRARLLALRQPLERCFGALLVGFGGLLALGR